MHSQTWRHYHLGTLRSSAQRCKWNVAKVQFYGKRLSERRDSLRGPWSSTGRSIYQICKKSRQCRARRWPSSARCWVGRCRRRGLTTSILVLCVRRWRCRDSTWCSYGAAFAPNIKNDSGLRWEFCRLAVGDKKRGKGEPARSDLFVKQRGQICSIKVRDLPVSEIRWVRASHCGRNIWVAAK